MTKPLGDFKALCHYDHVTESFIIDSNLPGWLSATLAANQMTDGQPQGIDFDVKVFYRDASYDPASPNLIEWERLVASYSSNGSIVSFTREKTQVSSAGDNAPINFAPGTSNLVIYGVVSPETIIDLQVQEWRVFGSAGEPAYESGWANFGGVVETGAFSYQTGVLYLRGGVRHGSLGFGNPVVTLPSGPWIPSKIRNMTATTDVSSHRINLNPAGEITIVSNFGTTPSFYSLDCSIKI